MLEYFDKTSLTVELRQIHDKNQSIRHKAAFRWSPSNQERPATAGQSFLLLVSVLYRIEPQTQRIVRDQVRAVRTLRFWRVLVDDRPISDHLLRERRIRRQFRLRHQRGFVGFADRFVAVHVVRWRARRKSHNAVTREFARRHFGWLDQRAYSPGPAPCGCHLVVARSSAHATPGRRR